MPVRVWGIIHRKKRKEESAKTVNETTLNELVTLTTLWTTAPRMLALISSRSGSKSAMILRLALQGHHGPLVFFIWCIEVSVHINHFKSLHWHSDIVWILWQWVQILYHLFHISFFFFFFFFCFFVFLLFFFAMPWPVTMPVAWIERNYFYTCPRKILKKSQKYRF